MGVILRQGRDEQGFTVFAGEEGEREFNDQGRVAFSYPTALLPENGALYVLDNGTVRRVRVEGGRAVSCETLAGVTPDAAKSGKHNVRVLEAGEDVPGSSFLFQPSVEGDLAFSERGRLLLSDPENSFIYQILEN